MKRIVILMVTIAVMACGAEDGQWGEWQDYDSPGLMVEGEQWTHEPTFVDDTPREYRYKISTNRDIDVFVAPVGDCNQGSAFRSSQVESNEFIAGDHGEAICVHFNADLISPDGSWHVEIFMREFR